MGALQPLSKRQHPPSGKAAKNTAAQKDLMKTNKDQRCGRLKQKGIADPHRNTNTVTDGLGRDLLPQLSEILLGTSTNCTNPSATNQGGPNKAAFLLESQGFKCQECGAWYAATWEQSPGQESAPGTFNCTDCCGG
jgi:hypothetical protein